MNIQEYMKLTGQIDDKGKKLVANPKSSGAFHRNWLNMMYARLSIARELLTEDGIIFISIDENEITNMRKICDEVFGTTNHIIPMLSSDNLTKFRYFSSALSAPTYQIHTLFLNLSVNMYYLQPILLCKSNMAKQNFCRLINVFRERSELWVYMEIMELFLAFCQLKYLFSN